MMVVIENVLDAATLADMRTQLANANWEDGAGTASGHAQSRKDNFQLKDGAEPALGLGNLIVQRLWSKPLFISAALPRNRFDPTACRIARGAAIPGRDAISANRPLRVIPLRNLMNPTTPAASSPQTIAPVIVQ